MDVRAHQKITGQCLTPLGANPLVAERAFPTSDYWGRKEVARCAEEMTGICRDFQEAAEPVSHKIGKDLQGALSATRGLAPGGLGTRQNKFMDVCTKTAFSCGRVVGRNFL